MNNTTNKALGKKYFDAAYKMGDKRVKAGFGWPIKGIGQEIKEFLKFVKKDLKVGRVLDMGCGEGRVTRYFASKGYDSYGIDFSAGAIRRAKAFSVGLRFPGETHFHVGNVLRLPYPCRYFDVAVDWSVFDHIELVHWNCYLKNLHHVLKPMGYYFLTVFSALTPWMIASKKKDYYLDDAYNRHFTQRDIQDIFSKYFIIIKEEEIFHANPKPAFSMLHVTMRHRPKY